MFESQYYFCQLKFMHRKTDNCGEVVGREAKHDLLFNDTHDMVESCPLQRVEMTLESISNEDPREPRSANSRKSCISS